MSKGLKITLIVIVSLIVIGIALRLIKTKKEGDVTASGYVLTEGDAINSNLLFLLMDKLGFPK